MADKKELLKLEHIQKWYDCGENATKAIEDISFSIQEGEFVGIMGASGSGKTTMLNCISTIDTVSDGSIYLEGLDVTAINEKAIASFRRENLGFIFQDFNLLDTLTVFENIALALTINRVPVKQVDTLVQKMAEKLNITDILEKYKDYDIFDVETNINFGCYYIKYLYAKFDDMDTALIAYNAGEACPFERINLSLV